MSGRPRGPKTVKKGYSVRTLTQDYIAQLQKKRLSAEVSLTREALSAQPARERPLRILSLDGGGIKGLNSLEMLLDLQVRGRARAAPFASPAP